MLDVVSVVADGDVVRRAPQGVIVAVLNQFLKAFGTNYFLPVSIIKRHFLNIFCQIPSGIRILSHIFSETLCVPTWEPKVTMARNCRFPDVETYGSQPGTQRLPLQGIAGSQKLEFMFSNLSNYHCKELRIPKV